MCMCKVKESIDSTRLHGDISAVDIEWQTNTDLNSKIKQICQNQVGVITLYPSILSKCEQIYALKQIRRDCNLDANLTWQYPQIFQTM